MLTKQDTINLLKAIETSNIENEKKEELLGKIFESSFICWSPYYALLSAVLKTLSNQFKDVVDKDFFEWWFFEFTEETKDKRQLFIDKGKENEQVINIRTPEELADYLFD